MLNRLDVHLLFASFIAVLCFVFLQNRIDCDAKLCPYVNEFIRQAELHHAKYDSFYYLSVKFRDDLGQGQIGSIAGLSYYPLDKQNKKIDISTKIWKNLSEEQKIIVIAHELGHSVLHRKHISDMMLDGSPVSMMHPQVLHTDDFKHNADYYWQELFRVKNDL